MIISSYDIAPPCLRNITVSRKEPVHHCHVPCPLQEVYYYPPCLDNRKKYLSYSERLRTVRELVIRQPKSWRVGIPSTTRNIRHCLSRTSQRTLYASRYSIFTRSWPLFTSFVDQSGRCVVDLFQWGLVTVIPITAMRTFLGTCGLTRKELGYISSGIC